VGAVTKAAFLSERRLQSSLHCLTFCHRAPTKMRSLCSSESSQRSHNFSEFMK